MKRERLQKLFSEDKEIFQGGMLFPTWICKGKEEIENRNIPQRAAVYLDIPIPCAGLLYYEKEKSLHYCEQQTYQVVTLLETPRRSLHPVSSRPDVLKKRHFYEVFLTFWIP